MTHHEEGSQSTSAFVHKSQRNRQTFAFFLFVSPPSPSRFQVETDHCPSVCIRTLHTRHPRSVMTLSLSGLHPITESPLPTPSTDRLHPNDTPSMSPATSNTARFADDPISTRSSALSSPRVKARGMTGDGFDVNAAYVAALRDEQVGLLGLRMWGSLADGNDRCRILSLLSWP